MNNVHGKSKIIHFLTINRNVVFFYMCLLVHVGYTITFGVLKIIPLCVINILSSIFYIFFLFQIRYWRKRNKYNTEKAVIAAYFEIILFSMVSEIFTRGTYGFIYLVLGMVPVIFYLTPTYKNKRFLFEICGFTAVMYIAHMDRFIPETLLEETFQKSLQYARSFNYINIFLTLFNVVYTSFFYEMELDLVRSELDYNSTHDTLTGLYNRRYFYNFVNEIDDSDITVDLLDIDNFKRINDRFGHDVGDDVLVAVSACINSDTETADICSVRWGGEEFLIFYRNTNTDLAYAKINEIRQNISNNVILPNEEHVTVTAGLSHGKKENFEHVVKKADDYLYTGKNNGKNCVVWYQSECT